MIILISTVMPTSLWLVWTNWLLLVLTSFVHLKGDASLRFHHKYLFCNQLQPEEQNGSIKFWWGITRNKFQVRRGALNVLSSFWVRPQASSNLRTVDSIRKKSLMSRDHKFWLRIYNFKLEICVKNVWFVGFVILITLFKMYVDF